MILNWKTIDKLEAKVPGAENSYKGEWCEFDVKLGRPSSPLRLDLGGDDDPEEAERFRIENKTLDIAVEASSLSEAKKLLREKLAASEDFSGTWKLWMHVDVHGGLDLDQRWGRESADCTISVDYVVELTTGNGKKVKKRHTHLPGHLPQPFEGKFPVPTAHKELSRLKDGPAVPKRESWNKDEVWIEATPELVETIRTLQRRLGESGEKAAEALSKKKFFETIELLHKAQAGRLLTTNILSTEDCVSA